MLNFQEEPAMPMKSGTPRLRCLQFLLSIALLGLIGVHAAAALLHGVVLRDGVLQRMLPWTAPDR